MGSKVIHYVCYNSIQYVEYKDEDEPNWYIEYNLFTDYNIEVVYKVVKGMSWQGWDAVAEQITSINIRMSPLLGNYDNIQVFNDIQTFNTILQETSNPKLFIFIHMIIFDYSFRHYQAVLNNSELKSNLIHMAIQGITLYRDLSEEDKPIDIEINPYPCWLAELTYLDPPDKKLYSSIVKKTYKVTGCNRREAKWWYYGKRYKKS
jgi:hypothetical protein